MVCAGSCRFHHTPSHSYPAVGQLSYQTASGPRAGGTLGKRQARRRHVPLAPSRVSLAGHPPCGQDSSGCLLWFGAWQLVPGPSSGLSSSKLGSPEKWGAGVLGRSLYLPHFLALPCRRVSLPCPRWGIRFLGSARALQGILRILGATVPGPGRHAALGRVWPFPFRVLPGSACTRPLAEGLAPARGGMRSLAEGAGPPWRPLRSPRPHPRRGPRLAGRASLAEPWHGHLIGRLPALPAEHPGRGSFAPHVDRGRLAKLESFLIASMCCTCVSGGVGLSVRGA